MHLTVAKWMFAGALMSVFPPLPTPHIAAQAAGPAAKRASAESQLVWIDTDIGDDVDDAFALGLALSSPELKIVGMSTAWIDPQLKGRLIDRLLCETGRTDIPVTIGIDPHKTGPGSLTQGRWAERQPQVAHPAAVDALLAEINRHPNEITLIAIAPLTNIGAAFDRDPATFRKLKRIVMMGGSINRGYGNMSWAAPRHPSAEYNITMDIPAAQTVFKSGVPIYLMPLDSTQIALDDSKRHALFSLSTNLTDAWALLYEQWAVGHHLSEPVLYDDMAVAFAVKPELCPTTPIRVEVDDKGFTRVVPGAANTFACLDSNEDDFYRFYMPRIMQQRLAGTCSQKH